MKRYSLTAEWHGLKNSLPIEAEDDFLATLEAIDRIMAYAFGNPAWAMGHIVLRQGDRIIHEMEAKS